MKKKKLKENSASNNFPFGILALHVSVFTVINSIIFLSLNENRCAESKAKLQEASSFIRDLSLICINWKLLSEKTNVLNKLKEIFWNSPQSHKAAKEIKSLNEAFQTATAPRVLWMNLTCSTDRSLCSKDSMWETESRPRFPPIFLWSGEFFDLLALWKWSIELME